MISSLTDFQNAFFIGIAGTGMSALAQYLNGIGKSVAGSDRYFQEGEANETREKLEQDGIRCFLQDGSGIDALTQLVVVSTAIEDSVPEVQKAKALGIPILKRSELLALIAASKKTIAVGGTSGKSTTSAMIFEILSYARMHPSIISGAGLTSLIKEGKIGNAWVDHGEWLVIEADESDGSIVQYKPAIGLLLNVDKDHKDIDTLMGLFTTFRDNSDLFIVNRSHPLSAKLSTGERHDFSHARQPAGLMADRFSQKGFQISFTIQEVLFEVHAPGKHSMENAVAAVTVCHQIGVGLETCAAGLRKYEGIYRRHQVLGNKNGVWVVDDYAHNPVKCAMSIEACQEVAPKVIAWFQPHGYGPTKFLKNDFVQEISQALRPQDEIWMSEIFYAGGTAVKDISAKDLVIDIQRTCKRAYFVDDRRRFLAEVRSHLTGNCVLLLMGARDPSLGEFAKSVWEDL